MIIEYCKMFNHLEKHHGLLYTLKRLKEFYGVSQRYAAGQSFDRLPWTKVCSKRSKLPLKLKPFKRFLEGTSYERRACLTVLSIYRLISSKNEEIDWSQVQAKRSFDRVINHFDVNSDQSYLGRAVDNDPSSINKKLLKSWQHCVNEMFPRKSINYRKTRLKGDQIHLSNRNGPNGPVLSGIAIDYEAIKEHNLLNAVYDISLLTENNYLKYVLDTFAVSDFNILQEGEGYFPSRFALKQEPGGKNRIFAIGDYFTQCALKSLHLYLFDYLKGLPEDGTHSHNYVAQVSKEWSADPNNRIYSIDLTGATNFIDAEVLSEIVQSIAGPEYANLWFKLMVDRPFMSPDGEYRKYTVGQPMGFLSSWAMLAIWNHLAVRTCRHAVGLSPNLDDPQYLIIGDDVAILGDEVAQMYLHLCKLMGVPTSPLKGFSPVTKATVTNPISKYSTMNSVEIAKRVFIDGIEISPISPVEIAGGTESDFNFPALLLSLAEKGIATDDRDFVINLSHRTPRYKSSLDVVLFPMCPSLNWVKITEGNRIYIEKCPESFWNGIPYPLISQLFYVYIKQRINKSIQTFNHTIMSFMVSSPDTVFVCRKYKFCSFAYASVMQLIARYASEMSKDIVSQFQLVGEQNVDQLDDTLEGQVSKSREVRRTVGMINCIFELDSLVELTKTSHYEDKLIRTDRIITSIVKDIKAIFI